MKREIRARIQDMSDGDEIRLSSGGYREVTQVQPVILVIELREGNLNPSQDAQYKGTLFSINGVGRFVVQNDEMVNIRLETRS